MHRQTQAQTQLARLELFALYVHNMNDFLTPNMATDRQ